MFLCLVFVSISCIICHTDVAGQAVSETEVTDITESANEMLAREIVFETSTETVDEIDPETTSYQDSAATNYEDSEIRKEETPEISAQPSETSNDGDSETAEEDSSDATEEKNADEVSEPTKEEVSEITKQEDPEVTSVTNTSKTESDEDLKIDDTAVFTMAEESADQLQRLHSIPEAEFFLAGCTGLYEKVGLLNVDSNCQGHEVNIIAKFGSLEIGWDE